MNKYEGSLIAMHDIFISYAHLDDDSPTGREDGWVTTLKHWLETALKTPLGRKPDIWMDYQLVANAQVTPTLLEEVRGCRALVLVLSPGYQNSEWCQRELINFLAKTRQAATAKRYSSSKNTRSNAKHSISVCRN
ncbi:MAG: toll/interleukin-1 receptor domain-containing protein [Betaproteobacteria bacterium]|nr:toll/interleukin-1 receptor domain-containing protein [Betaproteobacteria bacterium]